jgi:very-short-patch-repair endonuclease
MGSNQNQQYDIYDEKFMRSLGNWEENDATEYGFSLAGELSKYIREYPEGDVLAAWESKGQVNDGKQLACLARSFINAMLVRELIGLIDGPGDVYSVLRLADSPIEARFLIALILFAVEEGWRVEIRESPSEHQYPHAVNYGVNSDSNVLLILPQFKLGEYRVDFLLRYTHTTIARLPPGTDSNSSVRREFQTLIERQIIVECDGHDYHERTKEQARRDKKRDRRLQAMGFPVYRYTGSEIYQDSIECVREVVRILTKTSNEVKEEKIG